MLKKENLVDSRKRERDRFNFIVNRGGLEAGISFAIRTLKIYQTCLKYKEKDPSKPKYHYSRNTEYLAEFAGSILEIKKILKEYKI